MGMTEAILYGVLSLAFAAIAISMLRKLPIISALAGLFTNIFVVMSAYYWRLALIDSGKNTAWLGAERYPLVLCVYIVLACMGCICVVCGIVRCVKKQVK